jgi:hypothetical protein
MTVNHFGYAVHWFDSSLHHQFSIRSGWKIAGRSLGEGWLHQDDMLLSIKCI